jgi:hypothetical protein
MAAACAAAPAAHAAIVYSENFDVDPSANWTTRTSSANNAANFFFDYSTIGIPPAPGGLTTRGLKLEAAFAASAPASIQGLSASPTGFSVTGDFDIRFHVWHNSLGPFPGGGSGSTQVTTYGWGTAGAGPQYHNARDSIIFGTTAEGGATQDWRVYPNATLPAVDPVVGLASGGGSNSSNAYYAGFGGASPPAGQTVIAAAPPINFANQTGAVQAGAPGFVWQPVVIAKRGNTVTWTMNGVLIASLNVSTQLGGPLGGSNIHFGQSDINTTVSSNQTVARALLFGLIDNVVVDQIPEPGAASLLGLAALGLAAACRRGKRVGDLTARETVSLRLEHGR